MPSGNALGWVAALSAGLISFASPCVLPLVPGYLSLISGVSVEELGLGGRGQTAKLVRASLAFSLGFSVVFIAIGLGASFVGSTLAAHKMALMRVSGALIIVFGLFLAGLVRIPLLYRERRFHVFCKPAGLLGVLVLGMAFAFGWTPCVGPVLASILLLAGATGSAAQGGLLLAVYSLGLAVPFIVTALAFNQALRTFGWVKRHFGLINALAGGLLVCMGVLLLTGWWMRVVGLLQRILPIPEVTAGL